MNSPLLRRADTLRFIAMRLALPELVYVVRQPGFNEAYRITIQHHDSHLADQVATVTHAADGTVNLNVVYRRARLNPAFDFPLDEEHFRAFDLAMRRLGFDRRDDQPDLPYLGADLWLVERASGSFLHDVVLAPELADGVYGWFVDAIKEHLPLAVRSIQAE